MLPQQTISIPIQHLIRLKSLGLRNMGKSSKNKKIKPKYACKKLWPHLCYCRNRWVTSRRMWNRLYSDISTQIGLTNALNIHKANALSYIFSSKSSLSLLHDAHRPERRPALGRMSIAHYSLETRYSRATVRHPVLPAGTGRCHIFVLFLCFLLLPTLPTQRRRTCIAKQILPIY